MAKNNAEFGKGGELNTIIGKGTVVEGNMKVNSSLRIDGNVRGDLKTADTVIVGKEGGVEGMIMAKNVMLAGKVKGNVFAQEKVFLQSTSTIIGDIKAAQLVVDEGAVFDGNCNMVNERQIDKEKPRGSS